MGVGKPKLWINGPLENPEVQIPVVQWTILHCPCSGLIQTEELKGHYDPYDPPCCGDVSV